MKKVLDSSRITNLTELEQFCKMVRETAKGRNGDTIYLEDIRLTLVKERLTDGSHVFDIIVTPLVLYSAKRRA